MRDNCVRPHILISISERSFWDGNNLLIVTISRHVVSITLCGGRGISLNINKTVE